MSALHDVGNHLFDRALRSSSQAEKDAFGRSAFNRYYYVVFLRTRQDLKDLGIWRDGTGHKDVPSVLTGRLTKELKDALQRRRPGPGPLHGLTEGQYNSAKAAASELATLLKGAYSLRCTADYRPETAVGPLKNSLGLDGVTLHAAKGWLDRANTHLGVIRKAYRDAGLGG